MTQPSPAIVAQSAVQRLPRVALLLLCVAYLLPGFVGRSPWKAADITSFGYMLAMARGETSWWKPELLGLAPDLSGPLPYWLGAWAIQLSAGWLSADLAVRLPYAGLLALTLAATWYGVYHLARMPAAQPVAFAFGGEASPPDYARAMADGGLLALIACLGLAQLSHETTPALLHLFGASLAFLGVAAIQRSRWLAPCALAAGLLSLALSGVPTTAVLYGLAGAGALALHQQQASPDLSDRMGRLGWQPRSAVLIVLVITAAAALLALQVDAWPWRLDPPRVYNDWRSLGRLLLWFSWPAWPLAAWTIWRWRRSLRQTHVALPLAFVIVGVGVTALSKGGDRSLLLCLPAFSTLAAFALPTLRRGVGALIDWFTLVFFTGCAFVVWTIWIAMQTGVPAKPAANVARYLPEFVPSFQWIPFLVALAATVAWAWLVGWRAGRHRHPIWKSLVLPAGGATLSWLLLTSLWMPLLDHARSHIVMAQRVQTLVGSTVCVEARALSRAQIAALRFHADTRLVKAGGAQQCRWLLMNADALTLPGLSPDTTVWLPRALVRSASGRDDEVVVYERLPP